VQTEASGDRRCGGSPYGVEPSRSFRSRCKRNSGAFGGRGSEKDPRQGRFPSANGERPFEASSYRSQLRDRVVFLRGPTFGRKVTPKMTKRDVQRGRIVTRLPVESLIPARLNWFQSGLRPSVFVVTQQSHRASGNIGWTTNLVTGVDQSRWSVDPLSTDPVLAGRRRKAGMAIRFHRPVRERSWIRMCSFSICKTFRQSA